MSAVLKPSWWTSDCWATPTEIVALLRAEFGEFDLDPCCYPVTAKAPRFFTPEDDGLNRPWHGRVFLNPPYSDPAPWVRKAIEETTNGNAQIVVALLPAVTDTAWFHDLVKDKSEVRFKRGRIKFLNWDGKPHKTPMQGSMYAIYRAAN